VYNHLRAKHSGKTAALVLRHFNPYVILMCLLLELSSAASLFLDVSVVQLPVEELLYSALGSAARAVVCISGGYVYRD
jgi:hypothetical protein